MEYAHLHKGKPVAVEMWVSGSLVNSTFTKHQLCEATGKGEKARCWAWAPARKDLASRGGQLAEGPRPESGAPARVTTTSLQPCFIVCITLSNH